MELKIIVVIKNQNNSSTNKVVTQSPRDSTVPVHKISLDTLNNMLAGQKWFSSLFRCLYKIAEKFLHSNLIF